MVRWRACDGESINGGKIGSLVVKRASRQDPELLRRALGAEERFCGPSASQQPASCVLDAAAAGFAEL